MKTLTAERVEQFHRGLLDHVKRFFPARCTTLGVEGLDDWIRLGLERARQHGFSSERDLCKYLNLMFTFGADFDREPALPWASDILSSGGLASPRMHRLYQAALEHPPDAGAPSG